MSYESVILFKYQVSPKNIRLYTEFLNPTRANFHERPHPNKTI